MLLQAAWALILVPKKWESWCENEQLPRGSCCKYFRSSLEFHRWRRLMNLVPFPKPPGSAFYLSSQLCLFVSFATWRGSEWKRSRVQWDFLAAPLLHRCSVKNVTPCYRRYCGSIRYHRASIVHGWVNFGRSFHTGLVICLAAAPRRHRSLGLFLSDWKSTFQLEPPHYGCWPDYWEDCRLDSCISILLAWSLHLIQTPITKKVSLFMSYSSEAFCCLVSCSFFSITASHASWSRWTNKEIENRQKNGTPATKRNQWFLHQTHVCHLVSSNPHFSLRPSFFQVQFIIWLRGLEESSRARTSGDELLRTIPGFGRCIKERLSNNHQGALDLSTICKWFDDSDALFYHSRIQLCFTKDMLDHKDLELSPLSAESNRLNSERHGHRSNTD